jgi:hypothetical protein
MRSGSKIAGSITEIFSRRLVAAGPASIQKQTIVASGKPVVRRRDVVGSKSGPSSAGHRAESIAKLAIMAAFRPARENRLARFRAIP